MTRRSLSSDPSASTMRAIAGSSRAGRVHTPACPEMHHDPAAAEWLEIGNHAVQIREAYRRGERASVEPAMNPSGSGTARQLLPATA
jgi:hypothetical protein